MRHEPEQDRHMCKLCDIICKLSLQAGYGERKWRLHVTHEPHAWQADAIVANPISYGGPHLADHLGVPLHYLFTMPYSTTSVRFGSHQRHLRPPHATITMSRV